MLASGTYQISILNKLITKHRLFGGYPIDWPCMFSFVKLFILNKGFVIFFPLLFLSWRITRIFFFFGGTKTKDWVFRETFRNITVSLVELFIHCVLSFLGTRLICQLRWWQMGLWGCSEGDIWCSLDLACSWTSKGTCNFFIFISAYWKVKFFRTFMSFVKESVWLVRLGFHCWHRSSLRLLRLNTQSSFIRTREFELLQMIYDFIFYIITNLFSFVFVVDKWLCPCSLFRKCWKLRHLRLIPGFA